MFATDMYLIRSIDPALLEDALTTQSSRTAAAIRLEIFVK